MVSTTTSTPTRTPADRARNHLYLRTAEDISADGRWSAARPVLDLPPEMLIRVAKARNMDRWVLAYNCLRTTQPVTFDVCVQYTSSLAVDGADGIGGLRLFDGAVFNGFSTHALGLVGGDRAARTSLIRGQQFFMTDEDGNLAVPRPDDPSRATVGGLLTWMDLPRDFAIFGAPTYWAEWSVTPALTSGRATTVNSGRLAALGVCTVRSNSSNPTVNSIRHTAAGLSCHHGLASLPGLAGAKAAVGEAVSAWLTTGCQRLGDDDRFPRVAGGGLQGQQRVGQAEQGAGHHAHVEHAEVVGRLVQVCVDELGFRAERLTGEPPTAAQRLGGGGQRGRVFRAGPERGRHLAFQARRQVEADGFRGRSGDEGGEPAAAGQELQHALALQGHVAEQVRLAAAQVPRPCCTVPAGSCMVWVNTQSAAPAA